MAGGHMYGPYQWVSLSVALGDLLGRGPLLGGAVAVVAHVLGPQLQQRLALLLLLGGGAPGVGVLHPLGRVLPRRPLAIQLGVETKDERMKINDVLLPTAEHTVSSSMHAYIPGVFN